jgi:hypothetical protein
MFRRSNQLYLKELTSGRYSQQLANIGLKPVHQNEVAAKLLMNWNDL